MACNCGCKCSESPAYDKASELVVRFSKTRGPRALISFWKDTNLAKKQAMVCVDEMIETLNRVGIFNGEEMIFLLDVRQQIPNVGI